MENIRNRIYLHLTAILGERFGELANKLGSLPEEKLQNFKETGELFVELSDGTEVIFDLNQAVVVVKDPIGVTAIIK